MICKECGAYNPDHATYCKVCAASLKDNSEDSTVSESLDESRPTRTFVRPSWTVPTYTKSFARPEKENTETKIPAEKEAAKEPEHASIKEEQEESVKLFDESSVEGGDVTESEHMNERPAPQFSKHFSPNPRFLHKETLKNETEEEIRSAFAKPEEPREPDTSELEEPEEAEEPETLEHAVDEFEEIDLEDEPVSTPVKHVKHAPIHLDDEDDEDDEEEPLQDDDSSFDEEPEDDSYEYEPTPPKRNKKGNASGPLFWILLSAIIVVILCIIAAGILMIMQSGGKKLSCAGDNAGQKTSQSQIPAPNSQNQDPLSQNDPASATNPYDVEMEEGFNDEGKECVEYSIVVPAHGVITIVLPSQGEQTYPSSYDTPVVYNLTVPKSAYYPNVPLEDSVYEVHPEIYLTESDGTTKTLSVPSFTLTFPTLSINLEKPVLNEEGHVMANKDNIVPISGHVDDYDVRLYVNDEPVTVYSEGLFMPDYTMESTEPVTVVLKAEKENWVSTSTEFVVDPYVYTPDKMILTVTNDHVTELKGDKTGKITVRGLTLPNATLTASSDMPSKVVCGSVSVDGEGNFTFGIALDSSFYGISKITIDAEKEDAENGSLTFMVYRTYADRQAFVQGYNKTKSYKEIGSSKKYLTISSLMANVGTYATSEYGFRLTGKVVEVALNEEGYSVVRMTLAGSGETVYVINLSEKWTPENNIGGNYNLYGNFLGTYEDGTSPYFAIFFAVNK